MRHNIPILNTNVFSDTYWFQHIFFHTYNIQRLRERLFGRFDFRFERLDFPPLIGRLGGGGGLLGGGGGGLLGLGITAVCHGFFARWLA